MIDEADRDGDGEVNQQEFLRIMKKTCLYWGEGGVVLRRTAVVLHVMLLLCEISSLAILTLAQGLSNH